MSKLDKQELGFDLLPEDEPYVTRYCKAKKKKMCVYGHPTDAIFQPPTLTFLISNYSSLIFASDPINFYTEFGITIFVV